MKNLATVWLKGLELLERSIVIQSLLTGGVVGVYLYLIVTGKELPEGFQTLTFTIVSFWMGSKVQHEIDRRALTKGE